MFKGESKHADKVFEVKDISYTGMQISLKDGGHSYVVGEKITGNLHWRELTLETDGEVKWVQGARLGISFKKDLKFQRKVTEFLSFKNIIKSMRPIHKSNFALDLPVNLKYWLRADGQIEIFIWQHNDLVTAKFEIILMRKFVDWEDGKGLRTGKILVSRDVDTPLTSEDELLFEIDEGIDEEKVNLASNVVDLIPIEYLPQDIVDFIRVKLRQ